MTPLQEFGIRHPIVISVAAAPVIFVWWRLLGFNQGWSVFAAVCTSLLVLYGVVPRHGYLAQRWPYEVELIRQKKKGDTGDAEEESSSSATDSVSVTVRRFVLPLLPVVAMVLVAGAWLSDEPTVEEGLWTFETAIEHESVSVQGAPRDRVEDRRTLVAACYAYGLFTHDIVNRSQVELLDDPELYRSAELLSGVFRNSEVARAFESARVDSPDEEDDRAVIARLASESSWTAVEMAEALAYATARARPPSEQARSDFVVARVLLTRTKASLLRIGELEGDPGLRLGSVRAGSIVVVEDGNAVKMATSQCDELES